MEIKTFLAIVLLHVATLGTAQSFEKFDDAFKNFCEFKQITNVITDDFSKEINEKKAFIEYSKDYHLIQFSRYKQASGEFVYLFNYFVDSSYTNAGIIVGCYKYKEGTWQEITDEVLPMLTLKNFYGPNVAPPKKFMNTIHFRYELHKNDFIKMIIEPKWENKDLKKERIFDQKKYSAVQLKWNQKEGKFSVNKWLR